MPGIASAATSIVIAHHRGRSKRIRVGAGGIMLPNHAPYVIAEQFGTLSACSRAASISDSAARREPTSSTLRASAPRARGGRNLSAGRFSSSRRSSRPPLPASASRRSRRRAPSAALDSRIERISARCSPPSLGCLMLSPRILPPTADSRRCESIAPASSRPNSSRRPYAMVGVNIIAADSDDGARRLATTQQMSFANIFRGARGLSQPPIDELKLLVADREGAGETDARPLDCRISRTVRAGHRGAGRGHGRRRTIVVSDVYDHAARLRSFKAYCRGRKGEG